MVINPVAVEKLAHSEFAKIGSRQEALQTIFPSLLDIFYHPIFDFFQKNHGHTDWVACFARWLGLEPTVNSRYFMLSTASFSALGYENDLSKPVIRLWNDTHHMDA
jgi:hypothetical protein